MPKFSTTPAVVGTILNWDINATANNWEWRVPDITNYDPTGTTKYIIDTRIA
jgi:hypothetical protein